ncbi:hypothetical protein AB0F13_14410 [Streptomyces sp. NPDC026206]|uniref:hypothetical protein n=1 Tax=Streptomyces sp. NPDC026206 TaxID=3157089 RepID=UPI0033D888FA
MALHGLSGGLDLPGFNQNFMGGDMIRRHHRAHGLIGRESAAANPTISDCHYSSSSFAGASECHQTVTAFGQLSGSEIEFLRWVMAGWVFARLPEQLYEQRRQTVAGTAKGIQRRRRACSLEALSGPEAGISVEETMSRASWPTFVAPITDAASRFRQRRLPEERQARPGPHLLSTGKSLVNRDQARVCWTVRELERQSRPSFKQTRRVAAR